MSNTDFFDEDLIQHRDAAKSIKMGPGGETPPPGAGDGSMDGFVGQPVSDLNLSRMARHKEEVEGQVVKAAEELERLRQRQETLEQEKVILEDLRQKQEGYERGKREMLEHLNESLMTLEREEIRTGQTCDLLSTTRHRFKEMLEEIESVNEETWPDTQVRDELTKALAVIEDARIEFNKMRAKVQAAVGADRGIIDNKPVVFEDVRPQEKSFGYWVGVGFAVSLPLILTLFLLLGVYLYLRTQALI